MDKELEQVVEDMRGDIEKLRHSLLKLTESGLREKTVLILMRHLTGIPQKTIKAVFEGIESLEAEYFGDD